MQAVHDSYPSLSPPELRARRRLVFWGAAGFVGGLLPLIMFVVYVLAVRDDTSDAQLNPADLAAAIGQSPDHGVSAPATPDLPRPIPAKRSALEDESERVLRRERRAALATAQALREPPAAMTPVAPTRPPQPIMPQSAPAKTEAVESVAAAATPRLPARAAPVGPRIESSSGSSGKNVAADPAHMASVNRRIQIPPEYKVESLIDLIVHQRWAQRNGLASFPKVDRIECGEKDAKVECWSDVLQGDYRGIEYRYKIKIILEQFRADKQFVMIYRRLILSSQGLPSDANVEVVGDLPANLNPGWAPTIHRLPCELRDHETMICRPVGEFPFVLDGAHLQVSAAAEFLR